MMDISREFKMQNEKFKKFDFKAGGVKCRR